MTAVLSLSLISGPDQVRLETRVVDGYEFTLGRGQDADWSLLDPETNILSRRHCMLSQEDGDWWLLDLSGNGTFLNNEPEPIGDGGKRRLRDGDRIRLGAYEFQAQLAGAAPTGPSFRAEPAPWPPFRDTVDGPMAGRPAGGGDQGAAGGGRGGSGFANPFVNAVEEPVTPVRPGPGVSPPVGRLGNPFADMRDDATDDDWPSGGSAEPPPARLPAAEARSAHPPAADQGNPFADRAPGGFPPADPRPTPRPTPWIAQPPIAALPRDAAPAPSSMAAPIHEAAAQKAEALEAGALEAEALEPGEANPFAEPGDVDAAPEPFVPKVRVADTPPHEEKPASPVVPDAAFSAVTSGANPPPASPQPPASPVAVPASDAVPTVQDAVLLRALLQGAGIPDAHPRDPEQSLHALGAAFRAMITGLREVQRARRTVRGGFRIAQTAWTENPLKLAVNEDDALEALLGAGRRSAMPPARAVEEVLKEIVLHEVATVAAMQEAVRTLLASLAPDKLREVAEQGAGLTVLPAQRKARAWDTYEATHVRVTAALQDDFDSVFGRAFARAYERVMAEQKE